MQAEGEPQQAEWQLATLAVSPALHLEDLSEVHCLDAGASCFCVSHHLPDSRSLLDGSAVVQHCGCRATAHASQPFQAACQLCFDRTATEMQSQLRLQLQGVCGGHVLGLLRRDAQACSGCWDESRARAGTCIGSLQAQTGVGRMHTASKRCHSLEHHWHPVIEMGSLRAVIQ